MVKKAPGARGRPQLYSDTVIECARIFKAVFHLSLRSTQGSLESVVGLMGIDLPIPDFSTVGKRQRGLEVRTGAMPIGHPRHVVIDTTGLKVFSAGEWHVRKHGMAPGRRRIWRKLHLGVDERTKAIVAVDMATSTVHDSPHMPEVHDRVHDAVRQVCGDRAYDTGICYQAILDRSAVPAIPPWGNASMSSATHSPPHRAKRDAVIRRIEYEERYPWPTAGGATRQSLAENAVSRFKALAGVKLTARAFENQRIEALVKCRALNRMTSLGLPISERSVQG